jgi:hypothetical protein
VLADSIVLPPSDLANRSLTQVHDNTNCIGNNFHSYNRYDINNYDFGPDFDHSADLPNANCDWLCF